MIDGTTRRIREILRSIRDTRIPVAVPRKHFGGPSARPRDSGSDRLLVWEFKSTTQPGGGEAHVTSHGFHLVYYFYRRFLAGSCVTCGVVPFSSFYSSCSASRYLIEPRVVLFKTSTSFDEILKPELSAMRNIRFLFQAPASYELLRQQNVTPA